MGTVATTMIAMFRLSAGGGGASGERAAPGRSTPASTYCCRTTWIGHLSASLMYSIALKYMFQKPTLLIRLITARTGFDNGLAIDTNTRHSTTPSIRDACIRTRGDFM